MNVYEKLMNVQSQLKAPKSQENTFGHYKYRSCEDILNALKPLLAEVKAILTLTDTIEHIGERFYVKATAVFIDIEKGEKIEVSALAREDENKKGMDLAQVTGSVSSYARKYSLNGLFCIDDTKDADTMDNKTTETPKGQDNGNAPTVAEVITEAQAKRMFAISKGKAELVKTILLAHKYTESKQVLKSEYDKVCSEIEKLVKGAK